MVVQKSLSKNLLLLASFLLSSLLLTLFLFYIDEGNYTLEGMLDSQNLPALFIYTLLFFAAKLFIAKVVLHSYKGRYLIPFSIAFLVAFLLVLMLLALLSAAVYDKM